MRRVTSWRVLLFSVLSLLTVAVAGGYCVAIGQEKAGGAKPAAEKKARKFRGRLPNYYSSVVDRKQRQSIYKIQQEYAPKIAALKAQLEALVKERDEKVTAVLTPEQLRKVEQAQAAAKAKRDQKKATKEKPADKTPPAEKAAE